MAIAWHPYPDVDFATLLAGGDARRLQAALRNAPAMQDRHARLRLLDRLRALLPPDPALEGAWMQEMLFSNRPAAVHAITRRWPLDRGPDPAWRLIAAQVAQTMGERDEARARFRALLATHPDFIDAWQKFFEFDPRAASDDVARVQRLHDATGDAYMREKAAFALATVQLRDMPARALALLTQAHALKRRRVGAWREDETAARLAVDREHVALHRDATPAHAPRPVFIVGLPRSGTTLLTRMLGSHPAIVGVGEQPLIPNLEAMLAQGTLTRATAPAWYRAAVGDLAGDAAVVVDKLPSNAEHVGLILATLPDAIVVWLERDLPDCAFSIHQRDFEFGCQYADDPADIGRYAALLREHGKLWQARAPQRVIALRYERLVDDPAQALAPLLQALGLAWDARMLEFWRRGEQIATYSELQVRQPVHRDAIGGWRRWLPDAAPFFRTVGEHAGVAIPLGD